MNNSNFKVAMMQISSTKTLEENILKGIECCKKAKKLGADLAVFPEMWSNGYEQLFNGYYKDNLNISKEKLDAWTNKSITNNSKFIKEFIKLAKRLEMAIAITYFEKTKSRPKNTVVIIDKFGNKVLKYSKVHTVDSKMEYFIEPGKKFEVCELDYGRGKIKLGAMICYDRDFPESARILMLKGAEIIIVPNACYLNKIRLEQFKVRAYENMVGVVMVNYPINDKSKDNGKSCAYSPIVRDINFNEIDSKIIEMGNNEEISIADFDINDIREYRKREPLGDAYRKPKVYKELLNKKVEEPFLRTDAKR